MSNLYWERERNGLFKDLEDFIKRVSISVEQLRIFIRIGTFRFTGKSKKELLWDIHRLLGIQKKSSPKKELFETTKKEYKLPELHHTVFDDALDEIELLGYPLCSPFTLIKDLPKNDAKAINMLSYLGKSISMIVYHVTNKITRTVKGEEMCFGTFIDQDGYFIDTVHFPQELKLYPFQGKGCYLLKGKVVEEFGFPSLEVKHMEKLVYSNLSVNWLGKQ